MFICSTTQTRTKDVQNILETPENVRSENIHVPNLGNRKHTKEPLFLSTQIFFGTMRLFLKIFGLHQRVSPSFVSTFRNTRDVKKIPKGSTFYIFRHCDPVQKSRFKFFFQKLFKISQGFSFNFFHILQLTVASQRPKSRPSIRRRYFLCTRRYYLQSC